MQLSSADLSAITEKPSIVEDIDYLLGTDSTSFPLADKLRLINKWYLKVGLMIWHVQNDWEFRDSNQTTLARATTTLVANQRDYTMPTTVLSIEKVEIMDTNGDYQEISWKDKNELGFEPDNEDAAFPTSYDFEGTSIILDRKPTSDYVTLAAGIRIFFSSQITKFTKDNYTVSPGFAEQFHEMLSKGPAYEFAISSNLYDKAKILKVELLELEKLLEDYYSNRNKSRKLAINPGKDFYI